MGHHLLLSLTKLQQQKSKVPSVKVRLGPLANCNLFTLAERKGETSPTGRGLAVFVANAACVRGVVIFASEKPTYVERHPTDAPVAWSRTERRG